MFRKKELNEDLDRRELNNVILVSKKILQVIYILAIIASVYIITIVCKEWKVKEFIFTILDVVFPLFIGIGIAWLFDPIVSYLEKKKIRRIFGSLITYIVMLLLLGIVLGSIIPLLTEQINDFANTVPSIIDDIKRWLDHFLNSFSNIEGLDIKEFKKDLFIKIGEFGSNLTTDLPGITVNVIKTTISALGQILVGFIIGFYLLVGFNSAGDTLITFIPKKMQQTTQNLLRESNHSLRKWVQGTLLDSSLIFIVSSLCLWVVGLKAPMLFGLFCGITNVIPYAGPYIGGAPAVIVGFSQSPTIGVLTLISIALIQFIEGNFFQPLIMSRTTKLHPVSIILGLLIFGHFFGIIGMVISTPIVAIFKVIFTFFNGKYNLLNIDEEEEEL